MLNILSELYFPKVRDIFDESGQMHEDCREMYDKTSASH